MGFTPETYSDYKNSVRVASDLVNITVASPGASIDSIALSNGDRVLLKDQSTGSENGIYVWNGAATPMTRARDADQAFELTPGAMVTVEEGTVNEDTTWIITNDGTITLGATAITFAQISGGGGVANLDPAYRRSWFGV